MANGAVKPDLGFHKIGFNQLQIKCLKTDANSAAVYLFGISGNYPIFELYKKYIRPDSTAVDIGANVGIHSLVMGVLCGNEGKVYSFEPSKAIFRRLLENVQYNRLDNIIPINKAIGNEKGGIGFDDHSQNANIGTSHVNRSLTTHVPISTLDIEIPETNKISLLKIDVEGFEIDVLKGAANILSNHHPVIVLEFNPQDYSMSEILKNIPYEVNVYVIRDNLYARSESVVQANRLLNTPQKECNLIILPTDKFGSGPDNED